MRCDVITTGFTKCYYNFRLSISYTSEVLEHMDDGGPNCAHCKEVAAKKCSRCKNEWYCGRYDKQMYSFFVTICNSHLLSYDFNPQRMSSKTLGEA